MGKLHWGRHNAKPIPVDEYPLDDNTRLVIRQRPKAQKSERYSATARYVKPPVKGKLVIVTAYGRDRKEAEDRALFAYYNKTQAG